MLELRSTVPLQASSNREDCSGVSLLIRFNSCIRARMVSRLRSRVCFSCVCTVRIHALNARSSGGSFGFIGEGGVTFALGSGFVLNF